MRSLIIFVALLSIQAVAQSNLPLLGAGGGTAAPPVNAIGPVDAFYDQTGSSATTVLTTAILNAGTIGNANHDGWSLSVSPITGFTVSADQAAMHLGGSVQVDGTVYPSSHTSKSISYDHSQTSRTIRMAIPVGRYNASWSGWITFGPPQVAAGSAVLFDYVVFFTRGTSKYCALQLNNGAATGSTYGVNIETNPSGVTTHSAYQTLTPAGTYYVSMKCDFIAGSSTVNFYDTSFAAVGGTITATTGTVSVGSTDDINELRIGNNETGTATATSIFENWVVRYSGKSPFPVGPQNTTQDPVYWVAQSHNFHGAGTQTTLATTKTLEEHSGDAVVVTCSNENASGQTTSVTNTATETFTSAASVKSAANAQSISQWVTFPSGNNTSQLYTCNWPASQFDNIDAELLHGATAFDTGAVGNKASGADIASGSFTPTATATCVAGMYIQAGQAIAAGTNYDGLNASATNSAAAMIRQNVPNSSQTATGIHSNTSASMLSIGCYKP